MSNSVKMVDKTIQHSHEIEFGQTTNDLIKKSIQMRCTLCGYQSYTFFRTMAEVYKAHPELIELEKSK